MTDRSVVAGVVSGLLSLAAFALVAGTILTGAVVAAESGGSAALFLYALCFPLVGGMVGGVVVVLEDRRAARRAPPRMIALRAGRGVRRG